MLCAETTTAGSQNHIKPLIANDNQQHAQMTYFFLNLWHLHVYHHHGAVLQSNTMICAFVQGVTVCKYIIHNLNIVWCVGNYN
jgi:hypothetical protein